MNWHRYAKWDGTQEPFPFPADELLGAIGDHLMAYGDVRAALRDLLRRGVEASDGRKIVGAEELRRRVRERRRELLRRYNLGHIFDKLNKDLDEILDTERHALQQQQRDATSILGRHKVNSLRRALRQDAPPPDGTFERMWLDAAQRERRLNALPDTFHGRLTELRGYVFASHEAQEAFDELIASLQRRILGQHFQNVQQKLEGMSAADQASMRRLLTDLNVLLRTHAAGEPVDDAFRQFKATYPHLFAHQPDMTFEQFLDQLRQQALQLQALMQSLSPDDLAELQALLDWSFLDEDLRQAMRDFTELLMQLVPPDALAQYGFEGNHPLSLDEAIQTIEQLHRLDQLEAQLDSAMWRGLFDEIEAKHMEAALGDDGARMLRDLQRLAEQLEKARYIERTGDGWRLTTRAVRRLGAHALREIFSQVDKTFGGSHVAATGRDAGTPTGATQPYTFGAQMNLDVPETLFNAMRRTGLGGPVAVTPDDFALREMEFQSRCATALLIDQSSSMGRLGRFLAAKRVALALQELIRRQYPRDELYVVGFHTLGQRVTPTELATMREMPRQGTIYINEAIPLGHVREYPDAVPMDFTNVQEGLRLARKLLERSRARTKQIIMITDGQPTAYISGSHLILSFPEVEDPIAAALKEARRCTRQRIRINTFMLRQDYYLEAFVRRLTEINRGRAFFTLPEDLGSVVMRDYVRGRMSRV